MRIFRYLLSTLSALMFATLPAPGKAAETRIAVAANFAAAAEEIITAFEAKTGAEVRMSVGATGQLYAQILQAAPFDVFLAADQNRPDLLVAEGLARPEHKITYAIGRLVLYSADPEVEPGPDLLKRSDFGRLAIANPATAPYGAAAISTLQRLGLKQALEPKLVTGTSVSQTFQFVASTSAELGFVALAQVLDASPAQRWLVPDTLHAPIAQDAVLLQAGEGNPTAVAFFEFLQSAEARDIINRFGYASSQPVAN